MADKFTPNKNQERLLDASMESQRHEYEHLHKLLVEHEELKHWFQHDATVHSWLKMAEMGHCTVEDALIGIVVNVTKEKKGYFDEVVKLHTLLPLEKQMYVIVRQDGHVGIKHLVCGMTSFNANDVEHRYCGHCKVYVGIDL